MKNYILPTLLLGLTSSAFAQMIIQPGVIVNAAGDSLRGEISIPRSDRNPEVIYFTQNGATTSYRPDAIQFFSFGDDATYMGAITDVDKTPKTLKQFDNPNFANAVVKDTVFLSVVLLGEMSLFKLTDENSNIHYYVKLGDQLTPLNVRVRLINMATGQGMATYDLYKDQLRSIVSDCPRAESVIDKTDYTQSSLSKLVIRYNSCHRDVPIYTQKQDRPRLVVSAFGGAVSSKLHNENSPLAGAPQAKYGTSGKGMGGLALEVLAPRTRKRFSIVNEFMLYSLEFRAVDPPPGQEYFYDLEYFRYNLAGRYYIGAGDLIPYAQVGLGIGRAYNTTFFSGTPVNQRFIPGKTDRGLHFAIGLKYHRMSFQLRTERSPGFAESRGFVTKITNLSALLTIDFNKPKD